MVNSLLYYRLEIVDEDGSKTYSQTKSLNIQHSSSNIIIYPNPAKDLVTIECAGARELLVIDNLGRIVKQFNGSTEHQTLNTKQMTKGIYVVKAVMNNGAVMNEMLLVE